MTCYPLANGFICVNDEKYERKRLKCPVCGMKTRHIFREIFSGYGCDLYCGRCGSYWCDMEPKRVRQSKTQIKENIALVKEVWKCRNTKSTTSSDSQSS